MARRGVKVSPTALRWAQRVYGERPVEVAFTAVPPGCAKTGCGGYHPTYVVRVKENGGVEYEMTTGYHAIVVGGKPTVVGEGVEALARLAYQLLRWARRVEPWARYPNSGYRETEEGWEDVWF